MDHKRYCRGVSQRIWKAWCGEKRKPQERMLGWEPGDPPMLSPLETEGRAETGPREDYDFCYLMKKS